MTETTLPRRVVLLETDERAGLVAELTVVCAAEGISLDITTGPGHVLVTFAADAQTVEALRPRLEAVPGVERVHVYQVFPRRTPFAGRGQ